VFISATRKQTEDRNKQTMRKKDRQINQRGRKRNNDKEENTRQLLSEFRKKSEIKKGENERIKETIKRK
jgi:hypothetical protein